jgi:Transglycosylase
VQFSFARLRGSRLVVGCALAGLLAAALSLGPRWAEGWISGRIVREATARGLLATMGGLRVGFVTPLAITDLSVERPGSWSLVCESLQVTLRPWGRGLVGRTRVALGPLTLSAPGGSLVLRAAPTQWKILGGAEGLVTAALEAPGAALTLSEARDGVRTRFELAATDLPAGRLLELRRSGESLGDLGIVSGTLRLASNRAASIFSGDLRTRGLRAAALSEREADAERPRELAPPIDVAVRFDGSWSGPEKRLDLTQWRIETDGVAARGSLLIENALLDPRTDGTLTVERVDFARLLSSAGLEPPGAVVLRSPHRPFSGDMGSASLSAQFSGRIADPASFVVTQRLDFTPPRQPVPAIERLRGEFEHEVSPRGGARRTIDVSPRSPDFIAFPDVPPLFVRTLLLGEDSGFYGHSGLDLSEVPSAILTNWARGGAARGASTISQQLAKNLFLSRDKQMGRKLQELSLALLLESRLGKERILEIYLNIIEWGPDLYGLRPAARRYFDREPRELTPAQMALLVALIPGPVKYQRSLASGHPSPGFRPLVNGLLAKLRSVDALSEEAYQAALADELAVRTDPTASVVPEPAQPDDTMPADAPPS